jgi:hypothetical protein
LGSANQISIQIDFKKDFSIKAQGVFPNGLNKKPKVCNDIDSTKASIKRAGFSGKIMSCKLEKNS